MPYSYLEPPHVLPDPSPRGGLLPRVIKQPQRVKVVRFDVDRRARPRRRLLVLSLLLQPAGAQGAGMLGGGGQRQGRDEQEQRGEGGMEGRHVLA